MNLTESLKLFNLNRFELKTNEEPIKIINKRYKILARKYHPDKTFGTNEMMININRAHETLINNFKSESLFDEHFFNEDFTKIICYLISYASRLVSDADCGGRF